MYHYFRIFDSFNAAYSPCHTVKGTNGGQKVDLTECDSDHFGYSATGIPFNDAYRYVDWLLTVPLLLIEIVLVMDLSAEETVKKSWQLGVSSALMIILGYPGELILEADKLSTRWVYWCLAMIPFIFVVYTLVIGLADATNAENDLAVRSKIKTAQWMTVISWLTYPVVYIIPMLGAKGANAVVGIQMGYCLSDIISKCGVGFLIFGITNAKSKALMKDGLVNNGSI